jgi:hypothetical protein
MEAGSMNTDATKTEVGKSLRVVVPAAELERRRREREQQRPYADSILENEPDRQASLR